MSDAAYLSLENGMIFEGIYFGAEGDVTGEVVFTTGMTGYPETLTDPSYYGQIILQTFPLIGNYGVIPSDFESDNISASAYIVKHPCDGPSNFRNEENIGAFLKRKNIVGICNVDTRAITKVIRENGVMNGKITGVKPVGAEFAEIKKYRVTNAVPRVSVREVKQYKTENAKYRVALFDFGLKENIKRELLKRGCDVWVFPHDSTFYDISSINPDGVMLSNGPGNPADNDAVIQNLREIIKTKIPIFGICLGHQLLALAHGFRTQKMKYGHRGVNEPAKNLMNGRVYITSQNHGYAVVSESIAGDTAVEWFVNVNDKTCEGIIYKNSPAFSVQFHPEGCPGPLDTVFLFDDFVNSMEVYKKGR